MRWSRPDPEGRRAEPAGSANDVDPQPSESSTVKFKSALATAIVVALVPAAAAAADMAAAKIENVEGMVIGTATMEQTPTGVLMFVDVRDLPPGSHGIHLHAVGSCTPDFKAATGHINPGQVAHGLRNPEGPDNGDLPNLYAATDGTARAEFFTTRVSVSGGEMPALLDEDGSAVIIHENPDDHLTQPIGGAGGRIGCGIIARM